MKIELLDTTLREGEQSANVSFTVDQKIEILKSLDEFGVEFIEIGHPIVSPDVHDAVEKISKIETKANKLIHSRAMKEDIDLAHSFNIEWIGIFFGTSDLSLKHKFGIDRSEAITKIVDAVKYAKDKGMKLRFTAEDATRTNIEYLIEVAQAVSDAGADRFSIADTVGILTPEKTTSLVGKIVKKIDNVKLIESNNTGLGRAMYVGLKFAAKSDCEYICSIDSDGQVDLNEISIYGTGFDDAESLKGYLNQEFTNYFVQTRKFTLSLIHI